jgi:hypothetical protein
MLQNIEQERGILFERANTAFYSRIVTDEVPSTFVKHGIMKIQKVEKMVRFYQKRAY